MNSPFPGMNPFLEYDNWRDFHNTLAIQIKFALIKSVGKKYIINTEPYTVTDTKPEIEVGISYPDVAAFKYNSNVVKDPVAIYHGRDDITPPTLSIQEILPIKMEIPVVHIRDKKDRELIASIEILSPVNKKGENHLKYLNKRKRMHAAGVSQIEIDLLRRGKRTIEHQDIPKSHYVASVWGGYKDRTDVWAFNFQDQLPTLPIPLLKEDKTVLNLQEVYEQVYELSNYEMAMDYEDKLALKSLNNEDVDWVREQILNFQKIQNAK
ncbi:MAG: DUF4058 family protein [Saprospiraceae bacterium]